VFVRHDEESSRDSHQRREKVSQGTFISLSRRRPHETCLTPAAQLVEPPLPLWMMKQSYILLLAMVRP
jgi:hypothetical protein